MWKNTKQLRNQTKERPITICILFLNKSNFIKFILYMGIEICFKAQRVENHHFWPKYLNLMVKHFPVFLLSKKTFLAKYLMKYYTTNK